jgi:hypothetical protein
MAVAPANELLRRLFGFERTGLCGFGFGAIRNYILSFRKQQAFSLFRFPCRIGDSTKQPRWGRPSRPTERRCQTIRRAGAVLGWLGRCPVDRNEKGTYSEHRTIKEAKMHPIAVHALRDIAEIAALGAFLVMIALIARAVGS